MFRNVKQYPICTGSIKTESIVSKYSHRSVNQQGKFMLHNLRNMSRSSSESAVLARWEADKKTNLTEDAFDGCRTCRSAEETRWNISCSSWNSFLQHSEDNCLSSGLKEMELILFHCDDSADVHAGDYPTLKLAWLFDQTEMFSSSSVAVDGRKWKWQTYVALNIYAKASCPRPRQKPGLKAKDQHHW